MLVAPLNETIPLRLLAADGRTSLFGRLHIYNSVGTLVSSLPTTHVAEGLYTADWTPSVEGNYSIVGQLFIDSMFAIDAGYEKTMEDAEVNTMKANIIRLLGLSHENTVIDLQTYDPQGNLTSARIRTYDSKPNALAAGATGLLHTYSVAATYSSNQLSNYSVVRDA